MGTFHTTIEVGATAEGPFEAVDALVDSGATYTLLPRPLLERLGVQPSDSQSFVLADVRVVQRQVGEVTARIGGRTRTTVAIFGDAEASPLLGAVTLESFGLGIDPVKKELIGVTGYLVGVRLRGPS
ncbi:MAG: aspartyl protease family protein [Dehalococcoidia bacterium]|nr:aspartyl protease family protein [Dehalococcoidia bacterium]